MFISPSAEIYIPDRADPFAALARTTHLGIGAHHDDLEILAIDGILQCYQNPDASFTGVVLTDGAGSPRSGPYADMTGDAMKKVRADEQKEAARLGEYGAQVLLGYASAETKDLSQTGATKDLEILLRAAQPRIVYTHNLWDKHDTHVAVTLRVIDALRAISPPDRPAWLYGVEVWRDLDWVPDASKVVFNSSDREDLQLALLGVFRSQIEGGKRYDLAAMGRRRAHATYHEPHAVDQVTGSVYAVDMTPLLRDEAIDSAEFAVRLMDTFRDEVCSRIARLRQGDVAPRTP